MAVARRLATGERESGQTALARVEKPETGACESDPREHPADDEKMRWREWDYPVRVTRWEKAQVKADCGLVRNRLFA